MEPIYFYWRADFFSFLSMFVQLDVELCIANKHCRFLAPMDHHHFLCRASLWTRRTQKQSRLVKLMVHSKLTIFFSSTLKETMTNYVDVLKMDGSGKLTDYVDCGTLQIVWMIVLLMSQVTIALATSKWMWIVGMVLCSCGVLGYTG